MARSEFRMHASKAPTMSRYVVLHEQMRMPEAYVTYITYLAYRRHQARVAIRSKTSEGVILTPQFTELACIRQGSHKS
jgi:hypothetical protein